MEFDLPIKKSKEVGIQGGNIFVRIVEPNQSQTLKRTTVCCTLHMVLLLLTVARYFEVHTCFYRFFLLKHVPALVSLPLEASEWEG